MNTNIFRLVTSEIMYHKIQSLLIICSVALGIFAIFTLNSIGTGIKERVSSRIGELGADLAYVFPTSQGLTGAGGAFSDSDLAKIESIPGIIKVCGSKFNIDTLKGKTVWPIALSESCYQWIGEKGAFKIAKGRWGVAVGYLIWNDLKLDIGDTIELKNKKFRITGLVESVGSEQDDEQIYFTIKDYDELYGNVDYYFAFVQFSGDSETFAKNLENKFRNRNVQVMTSDQMLSQLGGIMDTLNIAVLGVAFISLLVGGITIANTVYATIKRRTREIGMLKAVGARNDDILLLFLSESLILSFLGGIFGITSGYTVAWIITILIERFVKFSPSTDPVIVFGSLLIAVLIGPIAAIVPALYAARLPPTEALRYE